MIQGEPLYRTFWVGMTPTVCGSESYELNADIAEQTLTADKMVIEERNQVKYEACHWIIGVEDNKYRDDTDAYIELMINSVEGADAYIY